MSVALCACGTPVARESGEPGTVTGLVTVFAAASMQVTFERLRDTFERSHPGVSVDFNFAGSQTLATQIVEGARADVFVSANDAQMAIVTNEGLGAAEPRVFATNRLIIAVPPGNPAGVTALEDLTEPGLALVLCAPVVPCGDAARRVTEASGVDLSPVSEEQSVSNVLTKVQTGEADAGLVYRTDVISAGASVEGVEFPESAAAVNRNLIVPVAGGPNPAGGRAWIDLVLGAEGQEVLSAAGFGAAE